MSLTFHSLKEAKLAIKQLKLRKKELNLLKKQINQQQKQIRAEYTDAIRRQGSKFVGGGGLGKMIRFVQTVSRDAQRRALAEALAPGEQQKQILETELHSLEQALIQIESYLINHTES